MNYTHLKRYTRPNNFMDLAGFDRKAYYVAYGQHRDSDTLVRSNFRCILKALGGESELVLVLRDNHWAVGWVEGIYVHESATDQLSIAEQILADLEDYPVVSEDDWSDLQFNEACDYWASMSLKDRVRVCTRFHVTPFAARHDELPEDPQGGLIEYLTDGV